MPLTNYNAQNLYFRLIRKTIEDPSKVVSEPSPPANQCGYRKLARLMDSVARTTALLDFWDQMGMATDQLIFDDVYPGKLIKNDLYVYYKE